MGRLDQQVKLRGFRIELGEIEFALTQHPDVHQAIVLVREDRRGGSSGAQLVAYVVPRQGVSLSPPTLRQDIAQRLPDYMIPALFMSLEALPVTPNGKVDRAALPAPDLGREAVQNRTWPHARRQKRRSHASGKTSSRAGPVGIHDDFFARGGHSLLAMRVIVGVADAFGVTLPVRAMFEAPTHRGASRAYRAGRRLPITRQIHSPLERVASHWALPLSFAQERFWFLEQLTPGTATYNVPDAPAG